MREQLTDITDKMDVFKLGDDAVLAGGLAWQVKTGKRQLTDKADIAMRRDFP